VQFCGVQVVRTWWGAANGLLVYPLGQNTHRDEVGQRVRSYGIDDTCTTVIQPTAHIVVQYKKSHAGYKVSLILPQTKLHVVCYVFTKKFW